MRSIIAISTTAKIKLANSQQFQDHLRATTQLIEARTVREIR